jgi:hypothetical protein
MVLLFLIWALYLILGLFWLKIIISRKPNREYNMIGSLFIISFWPIHVINKIFNL